MHDPLDFRDLVADELAELRASGFDVTAFDAEVAAALRTARGARDSYLAELLDRLAEAPRLPGWPYDEPSDLEEIRGAVAGVERDGPAMSAETPRLGDQLLGAWLGRCAGNTLGKPVEGWTRSQIRAYSEAADAYPIGDYLPRVEPWPDGVPPMVYSWPKATRGNVSGAPRDDDVDYTLLGLELLETTGLGFGVDDVGAQWLGRLPFTQVYTAERAAYRNAVDGLAPPLTATYRNPYREWIGALIRVDIYGYVCWGDPWRAAELAHRNASFSHTGNGVYAAMWAASLIASCFVADDMPAALRSSMACVPPRSRLAEALTFVVDLRTAGTSWDQAVDEIEARLGHLSWVHAVSNAAVIAAALLWGEGDFARTVGLTVQAGWDTDSNAATTGSAFGALHGAQALPAHMIEPLDDRLSSAIAGFDGSRISELAARTRHVAQSMR